MNVLITGGAGFIGSHSAERFVKAGHSVRILDDFSTGQAGNLAALKGEAEIIKADIRDFDTLISSCRNIDSVLHLAAISSVERSLLEPLETHSVNATGTLNILEASRRTGVTRVIMAGSASVYGDDPSLPKTEDSPVQPLSPYAWHKLTGEFHGKLYAGLHEIQFMSLRYFNVYGPRQDPLSPYSGVLSIFSERALRREPLVIFGDGRQTRDFIHVGDVAEVNLRAAEAEWPRPHIVNVATGIKTSITEAAQLIAENVPGEIEILHEASRQGDIRHSFADIGLLRESLGYSPQVKIHEGLRELVEWFSRDAEPDRPPQRNRP